MVKTNWVQVAVKKIGNKPEVHGIWKGYRKKLALDFAYMT